MFFKKYSAIALLIAILMPLQISPVRFDDEEELGLTEIEEKPAPHVPLHVKVTIHKLDQQTGEKLLSILQHLHPEMFQVSPTESPVAPQAPKAPPQPPQPIKQETFTATTVPNSNGTEMYATQKTSVTVEPNGNVSYISQRSAYPVHESYNDLSTCYQILIGFLAHTCPINYKSSHTVGAVAGLLTHWMLHRFARDSWYPQMGTLGLKWVGPSYVNGEKVSPSHQGPTFKSAIIGYCAGTLASAVLQKSWYIVKTLRK